MHTRNCKRFQLIFLFLSGGGDQVQCPENISKWLATQQYSQYSGEKLQTCHYIFLSVPGIERLQVIKTSNQ
jgi:hypothetical protein